MTGPDLFLALPPPGAQITPYSSRTQARYAPKSRHARNRVSRLLLTKSGRTASKKPIMTSISAMREMRMIEPGADNASRVREAD